MSVIDLPSSESFALVVIFILASIVVWDAFWLTKQTRDVPSFGELPNGGFAWASEGAHEVIRQWGNLFSMAAMMSLPWALISLSKTPIIYGIIWDILLALHIVYLLVPKRYALLPTCLLMDRGMNGLVTIGKKTTQAQNNVTIKAGSVWPVAAWW